MPFSVVRKFQLPNQTNKFVSRFEWKKKLEIEKRKIQGQLHLDYQKLANEHELRIFELKYKYGK